MLEPKACYPELVVDSRYPEHVAQAFERKGLTRVEPTIWSLGERAITKRSWAFRYPGVRSEIQLSFQMHFYPQPGTVDYRLHLWLYGHGYVAEATTEDPDFLQECMAALAEVHLEDRKFKSWLKHVADKFQRATWLW